MIKFNVAIHLLSLVIFYKAFIYKPLPNEMYGIN